MGEKKLQLREGAYYRTRDGRKAGPMVRRENAPAYTEFKSKQSIDDGHLSMWNVNGRFYPDMEHPMDLVAEWTDEPQDANCSPGGAVQPKVNSPETELERLVRAANEGVRAIQELSSKHRPELNHEFADNCGYFAVSLLSKLPVFTIKPRPAFPEFRVGPVDGASTNAWLVRLDGEKLYVGCKGFDAKWLLKCLRSICSGHSGYQFSDITIVRDGLYYEDQKLSWADCDRILAALEAYFAVTKEAA